MDAYRSFYGTDFVRKASAEMGQWGKPEVLR